VSLLESEEKYRTLVERANDGILIIQDFLIKYANKRLKEMLGVITKEITGTPFTNYLPSKEHSKLADNYKRRMAGEYVPSIYETSFICADGTTKEIEINAGLITYMGKPADLVLIRDITDRKRIEEALRKSEEIFRGIYEISPIGIELYDSNGQLTHANRACLGIFGVNDFAEVKDFKLFEDPNLPYEQKERLHKGESVRYEVAFDFEKVKIFELYRTTKTGIIHLDVLITPLNVSSEGSTEGYLVQVQDITKRKWAEEQIKAALGEKEILLREIHHRVKNNLQIISTLLYLQSGYVKDKEALEMFNESLNRVKSMALIHEKLYQFEDLGKIDFAEYIRNLTTDLFHSYGVNQDDIKLKIPIHEILLNINTAIPCGLIINELVSNSLKHAFPDGREGKICIDLHYLVTDNIFTLTVSDNGIGFLKDLDFRKTETLGLQLVITLVEQLKGTIELDRNAGTEFKVTFVKK
jgi:PAS domain S-box-containing protein